MRKLINEIDDKYGDMFNDISVEYVDQLLN